MAPIAQTLTRLVALCAFSAVCELLLTGEKLLNCVRTISGLLIVSSMIDLIRTLLSTVNMVG